jgi:putative selenate reductase FAD-binding subunit
MWSSITDIILPSSFEEAVESRNQNDSIFFSGGTYLVPEKNSNIHKLIDINKLTDDTIDISDDKISIGSKITIQQLVNKSDKLLKVSDIAKSSNFSKNIRNQRTIGGEIAQKNVQSDLFTYLVALNPILEIRNPEKIMVSIREWNGDGIINKILINKIDIKSSGFERFALLPSAPAFLTVAVVRRALEIDFVVSGKVKKLFGHTMQLADFGKNTLKSIINESVKYFQDDHYGTVEYKKLLVTTGIQRAVEQI